MQLLLELSDRNNIRLYVSELSWLIQISIIERISIGNYSFFSLPTCWINCDSWV